MKALIECERKSSNTWMRELLLRIDWFLMVTSFGLALEDWDLSFSFMLMFVTNYSLSCSSANQFKNV